MDAEMRTELAMAAVLAEVESSGGIARSARLVAAGHAKRAIAGLVAAGRLVRVRRTWVAVPGADTQLLHAARVGVVLTCVTQAARLGLWVLDVSCAHVAARPHASRVDVRDGTRVHWSRPLVPRHPDALADPIENVLSIVASCQPFEAALAVWESALSQGLVDALALRRLPLSSTARGLLDVADPFAGSGLETLVRSRLRWLRLRIVPQAWIAGHRVDFLIGERLVLQIDGGTHVGAQRTSDIRHDALLMLRGYHVIRVGYEQVINDWPGVQEMIMRAIAQGLHRAA
ncbi:MAG: DUF559 domain-containing protein [Microbacterium sp.]|uniref:endonuclease domain-containing protein n=1 Tax=Microbacterium sp. TaxID=51671 RepID=UPI0039E39B51